MFSNKKRSEVIYLERLTNLINIIRKITVVIISPLLVILLILSILMETLGDSLFVGVVALGIAGIMYFLWPKKQKAQYTNSNKNLNVDKNDVGSNVNSQVETNSISLSDILSQDTKDNLVLTTNHPDINIKQDSVQITKANDDINYRSEAMEVSHNETLNPETSIISDTLILSASDSNKENLSVDETSSLRIDKEVLDLLPETSRNTLENYINKTSNKNNKTVTIHTIVVGTKYEDRDKKLKELINDLKENDYFYELYEGYSNQEIIDGGDYYMEYSKEEPIYELTEESLPYAEVVPEPGNEYDPNAVAVYVGESQRTKFHLGYLPKEDAKRIQDLFENGEVVYVDAQIKGGKYKFVEMDDYGEEKVRQRTKKYLIDLEITFVKYL